MKESMTEARKRQIYRRRKRRKRKKRLKICACILMLLFLGVGVVRSAMSLIGIWENGQNEMIEQTYSGQGGTAQNAADKTKDKEGVFFDRNMTEQDKLQKIEKSDEYPERLKEMAKKNSETIDFVYDYLEMKDKKQKINLSKEVKADTVPLLMQWDERWGYEQYSGGLLGYTGCGPTNLAMVVLYLTGIRR